MSREPYTLGTSLGADTRQYAGELFASFCDSADAGEISTALRAARGLQKAWSVMYQKTVDVINDPATSPDDRTRATNIASSLRVSILTLGEQSRTIAGRIPAVDIHSKIGKGGLN